MDQSLEEIIRSKKSARGRGGRPRGRGAGRGTALKGRGAGGRGAGAGAGAGGGFKRFKRQSTEQVQEKWQHDMFQSPPGGRGGRGGGGRGGGVKGSTKLMISNLDYGVSTDDIKELFTEFGRVTNAQVHYDKSGRSLGTATVFYLRHQDAQKAFNQYNNVPLDGRPMTVQIVTDQPAATVNGSAVTVKQRVGARQQQQTAGTGAGAGAGRGRGRGAGGRGGRARGRGGRGPAPTVEELDADLDAYTKQSEGMES